MAEEISDPLLNLLHGQGMLDDLQFEEVAGEVKRSGSGSTQVLQDFGIMKLDDILHVIATALGTEVVSLKDREISPEVLKVIPAKVAQMYQCLPVGVVNGVLQMAMSNPLVPATSDEIQYAAKREIQVVVADPADIKRAIERFYGAEENESFAEILKELGTDKLLAQEISAAGDDAKAAEALANEVPIVKFVNLVLQQAVQDRASDIHFEPFETDFRIRYRVDGALYEMAPPPKHLALPVASRIKVMANLNISEKRLPQDGRINVMVSGKSVDLRVSTLPTAFGESIVLRVLDRSSVNLDLDGLGFPKYVHDFVTEVIQRPNGIFVVTGPTGCGKTTTLYSCLRRVNTIDSKLLTAEGVRHRRHHASGRERSGGHDVCESVESVFAPRPGHHHGRGNARSGNGADFHSGVTHRSLGFEHATHQ
jgi:type IV pilus assembly protein PilB